MSNNNSKVELIDGLVKKANFQYPAVTAGHWAVNRPGVNGLGPKMHELVGRFISATRHVYRLAGLSEPVYDLTPRTTEDLCCRALLFLEQFMQENPRKKGMDFVLMDGSPWNSVNGSSIFGYDVIYVCVFWKAEEPVVAIVTGPRKWVKTTTLYSKVVDSSLNVTFLHYVPKESYESIVRKLRASIYNSTNFYQLSHFGTAIVRAVEDTISQDNEYPIAAANYLDGVIWYVDRPYRHHHIFHSKEYQEVAKVRTEGQREVQGFLTNHGNFVTRYRAMLMAVENAMIVDTPAMAVGITASSYKTYHPVEKHMGGILRERDVDEEGYRICVTPLFSEDLF